MPADVESRERLEEKESHKKNSSQKEMIRSNTDRCWKKWRQNRKMQHKARTFEG